MQQTPIEWVKNPDGTQGYTWNPITGCLNNINGMCKGGNFPCYAYKLANGRLRERYLANPHIPRYDLEPFDVLEDHEKARKIKALNDPFYPRFWEDRLGLPIEHPTPMRPAKRKGIFVCDMGELFGDWIPESWTEQVMTTIKLCPYHRFYLLTKQPQNLVRFSPFPPNCYVGVSATTLEQYNKALKGLLDVVAKVKFISFEPLLEETINNDRDHGFCNLLAYCRIGWVIIGAQTKPYKPPKIEWVQEIVRACDKAEIPVFLKDNLTPLLKAGGWKIGGHKWITELRQEMPE